jgi:hypothetical protein
MGILPRARAGMSGENVRQGWPVLATSCSMGRRSATRRRPRHVATRRPRASLPEWQSRPVGQQWANRYFPAHDRWRRTREQPPL